MVNTAMQKNKHNMANNSFITTVLLVFKFVEPLTKNDAINFFALTYITIVLCRRSSNTPKKAKNVTICSI